jgi:hypothetical protein
MQMATFFVSLIYLVPTSKHIVSFLYRRYSLLQNEQLTTLPSFPTSISAVAFHQDGSEIAIASSYTFEDGDREHRPPDELFVRKLLDSEYHPKKET